jgi:Phosphotransferase enzyme family
MMRTAIATPLEQNSDLERLLEAQLTETYGKRRLIRQLVRRSCPYTSSFQIDELDVHFYDGSRLQLLLKNLSRDGMLKVARDVRPAFLYEPRREINAYRWILPHAPGGTAAQYGAVMEPMVGRYWLFLEHVDGLQLSQVGSFAAWEQSAAWIGRFHRSFSAAQARDLVRPANLLVYDEQFYWRWLDRAQRFAKSRSRRRQIDRIARRYAAVVKRLTSLPRTVIHGELYACNVLVANQRRTVRICPVDWEMAALGPSLIDLASLIAGWAASKQRALARAYVSASGYGSGARGNTILSREFNVDLDCCRLHLAMRMLGWSDRWTPPSQHARNWLGEATRIAGRLQSLT